MQISNPVRGTVLGTRIGVADRWWLRLRGLAGRPALEPGEGLLLTPCRAIHMRGMMFPLDVAFLDRDGRVVALYPDLRPGARSRWHRSARKALELPMGTLRETGTTEGDVLETTPALARRTVEQTGQNDTPVPDSREGENPATLRSRLPFDSAIRSSQTAIRNPL